jgi:hypothetical protein
MGIVKQTPERELQLKISDSLEKINKNTKNIKGWIEFWSWFSIVALGISIFAFAIKYL